MLLVGSELSSITIGRSINQFSVENSSSQMFLNQTTVHFTFHYITIASIVRDGNVFEFKSLLINLTLIMDENSKPVKDSINPR